MTENHINDYKTVIKTRLPDNNDELNWIIKNVGQCILGDIWEDFGNILIDDSNIKESEIGNIIIFSILNGEKFNGNDTKELLNYLLNEALSKKKTLI